MKKFITFLPGKRSLIAVSLLLFFGVTIAAVYSLRPVKVPPRITLAKSAGFLTIGLGFAPNGKTFVGISSYVDKQGRGCWGGPVRLWNVASGKQRATLVDNPSPLADVGFSPNSELLATEDGKGELKLWQVSTAKEWANFQVSKVNFSHYRPNFRFSPDSRALAFEAEDEKAVTLWDLTTNQQIARLARASRPFQFSPDGGTLAAAFGRSIRFWDVATGNEKTTIQGPPVKVLMIAFAPDGRTLAAGTRNGGDKGVQRHKVRLWDAATGAERAAMDVEDDLGSLSFSPDGQVLTRSVVPKFWPASWDLTMMPPQAPKVVPKTSGLTPLIAPDQKTCAIQNAEDITLWDMLQGKRKAIFRIRDLATGSTGTCGIFAPDGQTLAVGISAMESEDMIDRVLQTVDPSPGSLGTLGKNGPLVRVNSLGQVVPVTQASAIKLFDVSTGREFASFAGGTYGEFSPDGKLWAMHSDDGTIKIWDVPEMKPIWVVFAWPLVVMLAWLGVCWLYYRTRRKKFSDPPGALQAQE